MGTQYSSDIQVRRITEGTQFHFLSSTNPITKLIMKLFVIAAVCLAATVSAEADADAYYGYGYLHQQAWPAARGPGFEGTCYGCRVPTHHFIGKREAEADAEPYYGYGGYGYGGYGYGHGYGYGRGYGYGHYLGKRSADAEPHYGYPYAYHGYGYYPYALPLAPLAKAGVAGHPGAATSYVARSPQGLRGKRSAEPYYGYGFYGYGPYRFGGVAGHPTGTSYTQRSVQGIGK